MIKWITRLFKGTSVPEVIETVMVPKPYVSGGTHPSAKKKVTTKKVAIKKAKKKVDISAMKKDELLAHAKKSGVKVNASMKKADIIKAISDA